MKFQQKNEYECFYKLKEIGNEGIVENRLMIL